MKKINWNFIFVWFVFLPLIWLAIADLAYSQSASFVKSDTATQGNWTGSYGKDGSCIEAGPCPGASYAALSPVNSSTWTWAPSTSDTRALQSGSTRLAACWWSATNFYFDLNLTDGLTHQVSLYLLDWDTMGGGRKETLSVANAATGVTLASQSFSGFVQGTYAIFSISGHVRIYVTNNNSSANAVVSGVFFDTPGGGSVTPPVCPVPVHSAAIAWEPSPTPVINPPGMMYNVYQNGVKLTPSPISATSFSVGGLTAGSTVTFSVTAVSSTGESPYVTLAPLVVPSP